jgi:transcriptional regulator with XRE-family HTH domain
MTLFDIEDYRYALVESHLNATVAIQIKMLREKRGWSQEELARRAGLHQPQIALLESVKWKHDPTIETLEKIARAFEVRLRTSFEDWGSLIDEVLGGMLIPPAFADDPAFREAIENLSEARPDSPAPSEDAERSATINETHT